MASNSRDMRYWGLYSDLYATLSEPEIQSIENATKARKLGRFEQSRSILSKYPGDHNALVVVLEKANLELRLGSAVNYGQIIHKALQRHALQHRPDDGTEGLVLRFRNCEAELLLHGTVRDCLNTARSLKSELESIPLSDWTDLEIQGVEISAKALEDWLLSKDKYWQCLELMRTEMKFLSHSSKVARYRDFLGHIEHYPTQSTDLKTTLYISTQLYFVRDMIRAKDFNQAKQCLSIARSLTESTEWMGELDDQFLKVQRFELELRKPSKLEDIPNQFSLAQKFRVNKDWLGEMATLVELQTNLVNIDPMDRGEHWHQHWEAVQSALKNLFDNPFISAMLATLAVTSIYTMFFGADYLRAVQCLEDTARFQARYPKFDGPFFSYSLYKLAADAATKLGRTQEAYDYEVKMMAASIHVGDYFDQLHWKYRQNPNPLTWPKGIFEVIFGWLKLDLSKKVISPTFVRKILLSPNSGGMHDGDLESLLILMHNTGTKTLEDYLFGAPEPVDCKTWEQRHQKYRIWLWWYPSEVPVAMRHTVLSDLQTIRTIKVTLHANAQIQKSGTDYGKGLLDREGFGDVQLDMQQWQIQDLTFFLELCSSISPKSPAASSHTKFTNEWLLMSKKPGLANSYKAHRLGYITDNMLVEYQNWFEQAYNRQPLKAALPRAITLAALASTTNSRYALFGTVAPDAVLNIWQRYEDDYIKERQTKSIRRGTANLIARNTLFEAWNTHNHYDRAIGSCLEALGKGFYRKEYLRKSQMNPAYEPTAISPGRTVSELHNELINWAQKRKARSVIEVLGAEILIPEYLLEAAMQDADARELLEEEKRIQADIDKNDSEFLKLQSRMELVRQRMRTCDVLKEIMQIRDGQAVTSHDIKQLGQELGANVLIVDFVYVGEAYSWNKKEFCATVYKQGELVELDMISEELNLAAIQRWVSTYMDEIEPLTSEDATGALEHLLPFLESTLRHSKPGDTILYSLTGPLNRIPLHAVEVNGQPLIKRNKVVYTQSLTLFRYSMRSRELRIECHPSQLLVVQALGEKDSTRAEAPSMAFARKLGVDVLRGHNLTKNSFLKAASQSSLLHFYGHVSFHESEPTSSSLDINDLEEEKITVQEVFDMRLPQGAHVTLVGCDSGRSKISATDDMLGLCTGFFSAGAGSVVSTLWKIHMEDGHRFQEAFYNALLSQNHLDAENSSSFWDFAAALQSAILDLRLDEKGAVRPPYHWAGFTLQGCWDKFPRPT